jgi:hypothetical protein
MEAIGPSSAPAKGRTKEEEEEEEEEEEGAAERTAAPLQCQLWRVV